MIININIYVMKVMLTARHWNADVPLRPTCGAIVHIHKHTNTHTQMYPCDRPVVLARVDKQGDDEELIPVRRDGRRDRGREREAGGGGGRGGWEYAGPERRGAHPGPAREIEMEGGTEGGRWREMERGNDRGLV